MSEFFFVRELQAQQDRAARDAQNSARLAQAFLTYATDGAGEIVLASPVPFGTTFIEEPRFSSGVVLEALPDQAVYHYPRSQVGVARWDRNADGHYIGAWLYFCVDVPVRDGVTATVAPTPRLVHHLTFAAVAYKALPSSVLTSLEGA